MRQPYRGQPVYPSNDVESATLVHDEAAQHAQQPVHQTLSLPATVPQPEPNPNRQSRGPSECVSNTEPTFQPGPSILLGPRQDIRQLGVTGDCSQKEYMQHPSPPPVPQHLLIRVPLVAIGVENMPLENNCLRDGEQQQCDAAAQQANATAVMNIPSVAAVVRASAGGLRPVPKCPSAPTLFGMDGMPPNAAGTSTSSSSAHSTSHYVPAVAQQPYAAGAPGASSAHHVVLDSAASSPNSRSRSPGPEDHDSGWGTRKVAPSEDMLRRELENILDYSLFNTKEDDDDGTSSLLAAASKDPWYRKKCFYWFAFNATYAIITFILGLIIRRTVDGDNKEAYRWFFNLAGWVPIWYGTKIILGRVFQVIEHFFFRESLLYLVNVERKGVILVFWLLLLPWFQFTFVWAWCGGSVCNAAGYAQAVKIMWRLLLCVMLWNLANFVKAVLAKLLSTHFYRTAHFAKLQSSLKCEYYLQVLSRPKTRLEKKMAQQDATWYARFASSSSLHGNVKRSPGSFVGGIRASASSLVGNPGTGGIGLRSASASAALSRSSLPTSAGHRSSPSHTDILLRRSTAFTGGFTSAETIRGVAAAPTQQQQQQQQQQEAHLPVLMPLTHRAGSAGSLTAAAHGRVPGQGALPTSQGEPLGSGSSAANHGGRHTWADGSVVPTPGVRSTDVYHAQSGTLVHAALPTGGGPATAAQMGGQMLTAGAVFGLVAEAAPPPAPAPPPPSAPPPPQLADAVGQLPPWRASDVRLVNPVALEMPPVAESPDGNSRGNSHTVSRSMPIDVDVSKLTDAAGEPNPAGGPIKRAFNQLVDKISETASAAAVSVAPNHSGPSAHSSGSANAKQEMAGAVLQRPPVGVLTEEMINTVPLDSVRKQDPGKMTEDELEKVRTAVVIKTYTALVRKHSHMTEAEEAAEEKKVRRFAKAIFWNVKGDDYRPYLLIEDFDLFFNDKNTASAAFKVFDRDGDGRVSRTEVMEVVTAIYRSRHNMALSLQDTDSIVASLEFGLGAIIHFFCGALYLLIWGIDIVKGFSTFSTFVLSLTFVFGNSLKNMFEAMLFLFVVHPYDVGDSVLIMNELYRVKKIGLLYTELVKWNGERVYQPHPSLVGSTISNWSRAATKSEAYKVQVDVGLAVEVRNDIEAALRSFARANATEFEGEPQVTFRDLADPLKVVLQASWTYSCPPDDVKRIGPMRHGMLNVLQLKLKRWSLFTGESPTMLGLPSNDDPKRKAE